MRKKMDCFVTGGKGCPKFEMEVPKQIFMAIPFKDSGPYNKMYEIFHRQLKKSNYELIKADNVDSNIVLSCKICELIQKSQLIIADITEWNPNVSLEIGLALGLDKPVILLLSLSRKGAKAPSDLQGIEYLNYLEYDLDNFADKLRRKIDFVLSKKYKYGPYFGRQPYMLEKYELNLDVKPSGDVKTKYDLVFKKISDDEPVKEVFFKMPYHDTPDSHIPKEKYEKKLKAVLLRKNNKPVDRNLGIEWILSDVSWKRFMIKLPPMKYEDCYEFSVLLSDPELFSISKDSDFYDFHFHYPTEDGIFTIKMPSGWEFKGSNSFGVIIGESGADATKEGKGVENIEISKDHRAATVHFKHPIVGATYIVKWDWKNPRKSKTK